MQQLRFRLKPEQKAELREHFVATKFQGDIGDWYYNILKNNIQNVQAAIQAGQWVTPAGIMIKFSQEDLDKIPVAHAEKATPCPEGYEESSLACGPELLKRTEEFYRLEMLVALRLEKPIQKNFEEFIQEIATMNIRAVIVSNLGRILDKEREEMTKTVNQTA